METKCFFWNICGPGVIRQAWSKKLSDARKHYFSFFCCSSYWCVHCAHYQLRTEKKGGEEAVKKAIVVPAPYEFNSVARILRRQGLIVKNAWLNDEPNQHEVDATISSIEAVMEILRGKSC